MHRVGGAHRAGQLADPDDGLIVSSPRMMNTIRNLTYIYYSNWMAHSEISHICLTIATLSFLRRVAIAILC
jgi:hypothetical protein